MIRKNIQLRDDQNEAIRKISFETRLSESEIIRLALDVYLDNNKEVSPMKNETKYRGVVKDDLKTMETKYTKWYDTYKEAHEAAEKLCKRTYGNRGSLDVETK